MLRKGGSPFKIIFGLTIAQLTEIAKRKGPNKELALKLWDNNSTRCSMLLAPMLMPLGQFSYEEALKWCHDVPSVEVADILCLKLLTKQTYLVDLINNLVHGNEIERYISLRIALYCLRNNIASQKVKEILSKADILGKGRYGYLELQVEELI